MTSSRTARDYGARVGIWRTIDNLDRYGVRAGALLNSMVAEHNPQIIKAGVERDWARRCIRSSSGSRSARSIWTWHWSTSLPSRTCG
jgi:peptidoglycan/xylan/chitin deacetylase (PgdA/CDA1 family)